MRAHITRSGQGGRTKRFAEVRGSRHSRTPTEGGHVLAGIPSRLSFSHGFWCCIAAAVAVIAVAVPAASAGIHKYETTLLGHKERFYFHGYMTSEVNKCERRRRVVLFRKLPGADRKVDTDQSNREGDWSFIIEHREGERRFYVRVTRELRQDEGYVCLADRSPNDGALTF